MPLLGAGGGYCMGHTIDRCITITNLPSPESRRHQAKLCHLFKIANTQTYFPDAPLTNRTHHYAVRSSREHSLMPIQFHSNQFGKSYFPSTINGWNSLPQALIPVSQLLLLNVHLWPVGSTHLVSYGKSLGGVDYCSRYCMVHVLAILQEQSEF